MSDVRPVWFTEAEMLLLPMWVRQQWINAPADSAKTIMDAMLPIQHHTYGYDEETEAVLRVLRHPDA